MNRRDFLDPKTAFLNPDLQARLLVYSRVFAIFVLLLGAIPCIGWLVKSDLLTRIYPSLPQMRPLTAIEFILIGTGLLFATYRKRRTLYLTKDLLAFLVTFFSCISLYEFFTGKFTALSTSLESLFASGTPQSIMFVPPTISLLFIFCGFALLFLDKGRKKNFFQYFLLAGAIILLPSVIEHFYGLDFIYGFASHTKISLHVTTGFILLLFGILTSRPSIGVMDVFSSESSGGYLTRRLLMMGLILPLLVGGVVFIGNRIGWYDQEFTFLLYVASIIALFTLIIWRNAKDIHYLDLVRRESEQSVYRLAAIVESSDDAIIGRDLRGTITDWNKGAEELYGYKADEIIGKSVTLLFPKHMKSEMNKFNVKMKTGKAVREYESVRATRDGTIIPVSITASPIRNSKGKVVGLSSISRDISERKQIERQRELFIGIASHELKTPVTSTKAYAQILRRHFEKRKDKESIEYLTKMESQLNKLTELIGYLLDVSTIQKGQLQLTLSTLNLQEILTDTIEELQRTTKHKLVLDGKITKPIIGDKNRLTQVIRNLLTNAIKYSPDARTVEVSVKQDQKEVTVSIIDHGIGIPKPEQKKVFDPLYRSHTAKKDNYSGLGLGLYLTREIIKKHGGTIDLTSIVGKGTTISFTLPNAQKKESKTT